MCLNTLVGILCKERLTMAIKANIPYPLTQLFGTVQHSLSGQQRFNCGSLYTLLQELSDFVTLFGAFAKFRKAITSFLSVCLSVRPHGTTLLKLDVKE
jgi:hypothetical protein